MSQPAPAPAPAPTPAPAPAPAPQPAPMPQPAPTPASDNSEAGVLASVLNFMSAMFGPTGRHVPEPTPTPAPQPAPQPGTPNPEPAPTPAPAAPDFQALYVSNAINAALADPKLRVKDAQQLAQHVNREALTVAADGAITGLDAEIERLKTAHKDAFNPAGSADGGATGDAVDPAPGVPRLAAAFAAAEQNRR